MWFGAVTLFPDYFDPLASSGVVGRAVDSGKVSLQTWNPRDFTDDKHRTVDDRPYGGGPGMLMKVEPLQRSIEAAKEAFRQHAEGAEPFVVYMSPQGTPLDQVLVKELMEKPGIICVSGRYEGVDQRLIDGMVDLEVSLGDFVLSGGEIASMALIDACARWVPGVLGHDDSAVQDSFESGILDCPHYTRPEVLNGERVPSVLLSGDHEKIRRWRLKQALGLTKVKRPDLLKRIELTDEQKHLLQEYVSENKDAG